MSTTQPKCFVKIVLHKKYYNHITKTSLNTAFLSHLVNYVYCSFWKQKYNVINSQYGIYEAKGHFFK